MKYAIVESGGKQYRAVEGGVIEIDRLQVEPGKNIKLEQVLLLADGENITIGTPLLKNTPIWTTVIEHFKGPKVNIFNYSPKKRIRVKIGHRQNYTRLLVEQIGGSELIKKEPVKLEKKIEPKAEKASSKPKAATTPAKAIAEKQTKVQAATPSKRKETTASKPASKASTKPAAPVKDKPTGKANASKSSSKTAPKRTSSAAGKSAPKKTTAKK